MKDELRQLMALKKECKSASKERKKELQKIISELEASLLESKNEKVCSLQQPDQDSTHRERAERLKLKRAGRERVEKENLAKTMSEAIQRIQEGPQFDIKEAEAFESILNNQKIHHINPDGNCLFSAISHQLSIHNVFLGNNQLRSIAAEYISQNREQFDGFIEFDSEFTDIDEYCESVKKNGWWGGQVELEALSCALGFKIVVVSADGRLEFNNNSVKGTLTISYHQHQYSLGAHYNSIINV